MRRQCGTHAALPIHGGGCTRSIWCLSEQVRTGAIAESKLERSAAHAPRQGCLYRLCALGIRRDKRLARSNVPGKYGLAASRSAQRATLNRQPRADAYKSTLTHAQIDIA